MRFLIYIISTLSIFSIVSCENSNEKILHVDDYSQYLNHSSKDEKSAAKSELHFWAQKFNSAPNQFPYLGKMAAANESLFSLTGDISYLIEAANNLELANQFTDNKNPGLLRALAKNYISQHKFQAAKILLSEAKNIGSTLPATHKMLFDVHLEIGNDDAALVYLESIEDKSSFDYLIRKSKWEDHHGRLDQAIVFMEAALEKSIAMKNNALIQWSHTNLADFYGHAGKIKDAYNNYLAALEISPSNAYAKKGLAWIAYSHERNIVEAKRIIKKINEHHNSPDYLLLQSEMAEFNGNKEESENLIEKFLAAARKVEYGSMYNKYNITLLSDTPNNSIEAMDLAKGEIEQRPVPQSYALLAWAKFQNGEKNEALEIINKEVLNQSSEPEILFQIASIFKANNLTDKTAALKKELLDCSYELGPIYEQKIRRL